jgi:hypothetical protein
LVFFPYFRQENAGIRPMSKIDFVTLTHRTVGLHIYRERTIPDCPNKFFYTNQGEEDMWAVLVRDGQLMSEQGTFLYPEVMMMI